MNNITVSTDKSLLDIAMIHKFLSESSYWAKGRSLETVKKSIDNSLCFGLYDENLKQLGFARVITDYSVFAWIIDVFILEKYREKGLGKKLIEEIMNFNDLKEVKKIRLATKDAHNLYSQYGFIKAPNPNYIMEFSGK